MKIATWNVERLKHKKSLDEILLEIEKIKADILVLTETDRKLRPKYQYCFDTPLMADYQPSHYTPTENRVSIFTNYPCIRKHPTCDENTALCVELETERGNLLVYGTIIGVYETAIPPILRNCSSRWKILIGSQNLPMAFASAAIIIAVLRITTISPKLEEAQF